MPLGRERKQMEFYLCFLASSFACLIWNEGLRLETYLRTGKGEKRMKRRRRMLVCLVRPTASFSSLFAHPTFPSLRMHRKRKIAARPIPTYTPPNLSSPFPPSCYYPILHRSSSPFLPWEEEGKGSNPASAAASSKMRVGGGRITFNIFFKSWMYQKSLFLTISLIVKLKAKKKHSFDGIKYCC